MKPNMAKIDGLDKFEDFIKSQCADELEEIGTLEFEINDYKYGHDALIRKSQIDNLIKKWRGGSR